METMADTPDYENLSLLPMYAENCPTRQILDRVGDKWSVLVLGLLAGRTLRFSQLRRLIGGISQKMLTQTLRHLERDGLITRTLYGEVPPRVEYALTPLGESLGGLIMGFQRWAFENIDAVTAAQTAYDLRETGK